MPNYVPYLILTIVSLILLSAVIIHKKQFGNSVLFLCFSGMVYVAEIVVMVIGNSYFYYPEVLSVIYYDHVLGAIVSNFFVIPTLGLVAAVYKLRVRWFILFATMLVGVEWLFEWLNIYHTYWWRHEYTLIAVLIFCTLTKFWLRALQLGTKWLIFLSLWMQAFAVAGTVMYIMSVATIRHYEIGVFENVYRDDIFFSSIMALIKGLIFIVAILYFKKIYWRLLAPVLVYGIDLPLYYVGVLVVEIPFWIYTVIYLLLAILLLWWTQYAYSFIRKISV